MTRRRILLLLYAALTTLLVGHRVAFADPPPNYDFVSYDEGLRRAAKEGKPIFLYFGRYGCAWCDWTNRETFSNADLRKLYSEHYVLVYADAESGKRLTLPNGERITEAELGTRFRAFATPLFVYLDASGTEVFKAPGFKTVTDFQDFDRYVSGGHYKNQKFMEFLGSGK
jgi:thioredoxin-related protein